MKFNDWLDKFIEEKEIDLEQTFEVMSESQVEHHMSYQVVVDHIKITGAEEQKAIQDMIVKIDFRNGDILHFFRHLAKALANKY